MTSWSQMFIISAYQKASGNWDSIVKSKDIILLTKVYIVKAMVFLVVMYGCESQTIKKAEHRIILSNCGAGEDSFKNPLESKIKPVNPKGNQPWIFTERIDAEALILWLPDAKSRLTGKPWC